MWVTDYWSDRYASWVIDYWSWKIWFRSVEGENLKDIFSFTNSFHVSFWKAEATFSHQSVISDCYVWSSCPDASTLSWRAEVEAADNVNLYIVWWFISNFVMTFPQVVWVWLSSNASRVACVWAWFIGQSRSGGECEGKFNMMFYFKFGHELFLR